MILVFDSVAYFQRKIKAIANNIINYVQNDLPNVVLRPSNIEHNKFNN